MAENGSLTIKIDGDASDLEKKLKDVESLAKDSSASIEKSTSKAGTSIKNNLGGTMKEVAKEHKTETKTVVENIDKIVDGNEKVIKQKDDLDDVYDGIKNSSGSAGTKIKAGLADIKAGIDMAAAAARSMYNVASKGVNYNATIEQLKTSFEVMTGSAEKAADVVERLRVMGAETPFEFADLASTTQLLMQYGFAADEAIDRMSMLGDIAQGNKEAMNSIALGYAQMSSAGKVNLQDIKQMINVCHAA